MTDETARPQAAKPDPTTPDLDDPALDEPVAEEEGGVLDLIEDHQAQIDGLHTRIDEMQQRTDSQFAKQAESLDRILDAVKQPAAPGSAAPGPAPVAATPAEPAYDPPSMPLPEGTTRFVSTSGGRDFQIRLKQRGFMSTGEGRHEIIPEKFLIFANNIATTDDQELIDLARGYIEKKGPRAEFFEDPTAAPTSRVVVSDGARSTAHAAAHTPAPELAARN